MAAEAQPMKTQRRSRRLAPRPAIPAAIMDGPACATCGKPEALCVCDAVTPIANRIELLVLQHPQEQDKTLGTARVAVSHFANATFRVGLSWPSLQAALDREADPKRWAVVYMGAADDEAVQPAVQNSGQGLVLLDRNSRPFEYQKSAYRELEGIVLFDGTWSQAKTLWWRNAWVLKCPRLLLHPAQPSLYGKLRKEPRKEGLSTLEAAAFAISRLEGKPQIETAMLSTFRRMLQRYRDALQSTA